jgi:hypothetical protein
LALLHAIRREREDLSGKVMSGREDADQPTYMVSRFVPNDFPVGSGAESCSR